MFVLSAGLFRTGAVNFVVVALNRFGDFLRVGMPLSLILWLLSSLLIPVFWPF